MKRVNEIDLMEFLVELSEHDVPNLNGHSVHVHRLSMLVYNQLSLKERMGINKRNLEYSSLLFSVGKSMVLKHIANAEGSFSTEDKEKMASYPQVGADLIERVLKMDDVARIIKYHHINYNEIDTSKNDVPYEAFIISVCDMYSAIVMNRSYKARKTYEEAIFELDLAAGHRLNKDTVEVFKRIPITTVKKCDSDIMKLMGQFDY